ncbi:hypothetical protein [Lewinella sp. LCG006]|uniref:hypothetical protein n=1 Tax=Lewinella sp. LCG006 TaxID=3231911 RepID=UPI00345FF957
MSIQKIISTKSNLVTELLQNIAIEEDWAKIEQFTIALIDNFKDPRILPGLVEKINTLPFDEANAFLVYACGEYSLEDCKVFFDLWIELVAMGDFHTASNAGFILANLPEPFDFNERQLDQAENKLMLALSKPVTEEKALVIKEVLELLK